MTAIRPTETELRDKIDADGYNSILNEINSKYTEMDKYISNLQSDILSIKDFGTQGAFFVEQYLYFNITRHHGL